MDVKIQFFVATLFYLRSVVASDFFFSVVIQPSGYVLYPASVLPLHVGFVPSGDKPISVVQLILNGPKEVCLLPRETNSSENICGADSNCVTTCNIQLNKFSNGIYFNMTYNTEVDFPVIRSDKTLTIHAKVDGEDVTDIAHNKFIVRDGRKVVVGFNDSLHRLVTQEPLSLSTMRYGDTSLSIDKNLTIVATLWQSDDGENWKKTKELRKINEMLKELSNWTVLVDELNENLFYKVELTTSLSDIVELQPSVVKIYPTIPKLLCGKLADNVRDLIKNHQVNETAVDNILDQMCQLVNDSKSSQIDITSPPTGTTEPTTSTIEPTNSTIEPTNSTIEPTNSTTEPSTPTTEPSTATIEPTSPTDALTTKPTVATKPPTPTTKDSNGGGTSSESPSGETPEGENEDNRSDESDSSMMWYAFLGLVVILLAVGVSGYLLFNHHAKVKVYLFQLVGKSGSSLSPSIGRRVKPGAAKYTPLPTNVRETMLHQD